MENSKIEWTDHTFNPWMGCTKVSPACKNCYAERDMDHRYGKVAWGPNGTRVRTSKANWKKPVQWDMKAGHKGIRERVFCASLADVFEDWNGPIHGSGKDDETLAIDDARSRLITMDDVRRDLYELIDATPNLIWLLLTKRPENFDSMWDGRSRDNVWLGTSVENQECVDKRLPYLHEAKRNSFVARTFVSAEPLVEAIHLHGRLEGHVYNHLGDGGIDWVITGGESGPNARPCDASWFRSLRDQCDAAGTPFHFKQWGEFDKDGIRIGKKNAGRLLDSRTHDDVPEFQAANVI